MSKIKKINPKKNQIVRVKFKNIGDFLDEIGFTFSQADDMLAIGRNIKAYLQGGDFLVDRNLDVSDVDEDLGNCLYLKNHLDNSFDFVVYDCAIEDISIVDDAQIFSSQPHNLMVVRIGDELFINGVPLIGRDHQDDIRGKHYSKKENSNYNSEGRKLLEIFENFIADLAVKESLSCKKGVNK